MMKRKIAPGQISIRAAQRIGAVRVSRRLTYAEMSRKLAEMGREIPPLGLRRIESCERRIDLDDLAGIAEVLDVPWQTLVEETIPVFLKEDPAVESIRNLL